MKTGRLFRLLLAAGFAYGGACIPKVSAATLGVDWGGAYGNGFTGALNQGVGAATTATGDFTFDGISDAAYLLPFGTAYTPSLDSRYLAPAGKTGPLFTGVQLVNHSSSTVPTEAGLYRWSASTDPNQLHKTNPTNGGSDPMSMAVSYYVKKTDFLNGLDAGSVRFADDPAGVSVSMASLRNKTNGVATIAFIVQEGTGWYAAIATNRATSGADWSGTLALNPYAADWHAFDPSSNLLLDTANLGAAKVGSTFANITAFGVLGQSMGYDGTVANTQKLDFTGLSARFTAAAPPPTEYAVDFGATYTLVNINSSKTETLSNGDFDFDGDSDDRAAVVAFGSVFTPPNNVNWTNAPGKSNGTIYHGVSVAVLNNQAVDPTVAIDRIATNNRIQIGNTKIAGETLSQAMAVYWTAADFLNGGPAAMADEADSLSVALNSTGIKPHVRFMVQADGQWYVSAASSQGSFGINGATAQWHAFNPSANNLFLDESNLGASVGGASLGAIEAAGVYGQAAGYDGTTGSLFGMDGLQITVESFVDIDYASWAAGYGLTNGNADAVADPDGDGMVNLVEYALGGDPTIADASAILPTSALQTVGSAKVFTYVYNRRRDAAARGLAYTVELGGDLVYPGWSTNGVDVAGVEPVDAEFEAVTNTVEAVMDKEYLRLQIGLEE